MEELRVALEEDPSSLQALLHRPDVLSQLRGNELGAWLLLRDALKRAKDDEGGRTEAVLQVGSLSICLLGEGKGEEEDVPPPPGPGPG